MMILIFMIVALFFFLFNYVVARSFEEETMFLNGGNDTIEFYGKRRKENE